MEASAACQLLELELALDAAGAGVLAEEPFDDDVLDLVSEPSEVELVELESDEPFELDPSLAEELLALLPPRLSVL